MKITQVIAFSFAALVVNGAGIPQPKYGNSTSEIVNTSKNISTLGSLENSDLEESKATNPTLTPSLAVEKITEGDVTNAQKTTEDETRDRVVVVMKDILGGVLDAFDDFGAAAGIEMNTLLKDTGYEVESSVEKRNQRAELKKRTGLGLIVGLVPVALRLLKVVLGGVSSLTGAACGTCISRPELAFAANAAGAISAVL